MNSLPRQKLCELIAMYGDSLCDQRLRCEGLLRDFCPKDRDRREINVLMNALKERVAVDLRNSSVSIPVVVTLARLSKRLEDQQALTPQMARWVVESWALALGKISVEHLSAATSPIAKERRRTPAVIRSVSTQAFERARAVAGRAAALALTGGKELGRGVAVAVVPALLVAASIWYVAHHPIRWTSPQVRPRPSPPAQPPIVVAHPPAQTATPVLLQPTAIPIAAGSLQVNTTPSGAKIIVDGSIIRTSPVTVSNLAPGKHQVEVVMDGYVTEQTDVEVRDTQITSQAITLRAVPAPVQPAATPNVVQQVPAKKTPRPKQPAQLQTPTSIAARQSAPASTPARIILKTVAPPRPGESPQRHRPEFEGTAPGG